MSEATNPEAQEQTNEFHIHISGSDVTNPNCVYSFSQMEPRDMAAIFGNILSDCITKAASQETSDKLVHDLKQDAMTELMKQLNFSSSSIWIPVDKDLPNDYLDDLHREDAQYPVKFNQRLLVALKNGIVMSECHFEKEKMSFVDMKDIEYEVDQVAAWVDTPSYYPESEIPQA